MFCFDFNHNDFTLYLKDYAKSLGVKLSADGVLYFPEKYASGYQKVFVLPNRLQALVYEFKLNQDICLNRLRSAEEFYNLRFDVIHIKDDITVRYGKEYMTQGAHQRSAVVLTSSHFEFGYIGKKGSHSKGINILITQQWLAAYLGISAKDEVLQKYLALKTASFNFEPFDVEYRRLFTEIFELEKQEGPLKLITIQNRLMLLIERFFTRLYKKMDKFAGKFNINNTEIQGLMDVEALLVKDYTGSPQGIPELAKMAAMSETKLKTLFKKVYGQSPYEYYQKNRMLKARDLLLSKKYSVKEIGTRLGFKNLSNFTIAFKKEFNILPSDV